MDGKAWIDRIGSRGTARDRGHGAVLGAYGSHVLQTEAVGEPPFRARFAGFLLLRRRRHGLACSTAGRPLPNRKPRRLAHRCRRGRQRDPDLELDQRHGLHGEWKLERCARATAGSESTPPPDDVQVPTRSPARGLAEAQAGSASVSGRAGGNADREPVGVTRLRAFKARATTPDLDLDERHGMRRIGRVERHPSRQRLGVPRRPSLSNTSFTLTCSGARAVPPRAPSWSRSRPHWAGRAHPDPGGQPDFSEPGKHDDDFLGQQQRRCLRRVGQLERLTRHQRQRDECPACRQRELCARPAPVPAAAPRRR